MGYSTIAIKPDLKKELLILQITIGKKNMEELLKDLLENYKKQQEVKEDVAKV